MSRQAALHPRFSAKAAFDGNIIDASDDEYATHKAKNYPRGSGQCSVKAAQPTAEFQAVRRVQRAIAPAGRVVNAQVRQPVATPASNPNNQVWGQEMGRRQVEHQKLQRAGRLGASVPEHNANSFVATVPRELLESESFILEMPQSALRYHELANEAIPRPEDAVDEDDLQEEEDLKANRLHWRGKQVVQQAAAKQCGVPQQRAIVRGPGCQQRAAPPTKDTLRAVPRKVVPRQATVPVKKAAVRQAVVPQRTVVAAKKKAAPVKRAGGCPCNAK